MNLAILATSSAGCDTILASATVSFSLASVLIAVVGEVVQVTQYVCAIKRLAQEFVRRALALLLVLGLFVARHFVKT